MHSHSADANPSHAGQDCPPQATFLVPLKTESILSLRLTTTEQRRTEIASRLDVLRPVLQQHGLAFPDADAVLAGHGAAGGDGAADNLPVNLVEPLHLRRLRHGRRTRKSVRETLWRRNKLDSKHASTHYAHG